MKAACQDTVSSVECFFNTVAMMTIDVNVEDARVDAKELKDGENDVVDVAEAGRFALFGVMKATCPVYGNVTRARKKSLSSILGERRIVT
jgi:hypothetical protein